MMVLFTVNDDDHDSEEIHVNLYAQNNRIIMKQK